MMQLLPFVALVLMVSWTATAFHVARNLITSPKKLQKTNSRIGSTLVDAPAVVLAGFDYKTSNKLPWIETGYSSWLD